LKSNGTGLYATKDLALAQIKFDQFKVDRSLYVVDSSQSLHFAQVFKTLEKMGYKQAEKCIHIPYNLVVAPDGKMSSRLGNVILFDDLRVKLGEALNEAFLDQSNFNEEEKTKVRNACSVGSIRYGMLNHDVAREIVFDIKKWTSAAKGDTGPYLMMQYARVQSIDRKVTVDPSAVANYALLTDEKSQELLLELSQFQNAVLKVVNQKVPNPSSLCSYLFHLSQTFSSWYDKPEHNIRRCQDPNLQLTYLHLVKAFSLVIGQGLQLLGIPPLDKM